MRHAVYYLHPHTRVHVDGTVWLLMRCWAIHTVHTGRATHEGRWGGQLVWLCWRCKTAEEHFCYRGPQTRKARSVWEETRREFLGDVERAWDGGVRALRGSFTVLSHQWQKEPNLAPTLWWRLTARCQIGLHRPDGAGQLEPNSWWRLWCLIEAADDIHQHAHLPSFIMSFIQPLCEYLVQISLMTKCCKLIL